jgi:hypothetical protein
MRIRTQKTTYTVSVYRGADRASFEVKPLDPSENAKLLKKHTTHKRVKSQMVEDVDFVAFRLDKICKTIIGWDLKDEDGADFPCTDENKKTAFLLNADIINEAMEKADEIAEGKVLDEEEQAKN